MTFDFPAPLFSGSTFDPGFLSSFLFDEPVFFSPTPVSSGSDSIPVSSPDITKNPSPGSKNKRPAGSSETSNCLDERKRRRKISNRESARRSRERKQKHVEDLRIQVNRLKVENRELMNRLRYVVHYTGLFNTENEFLRSESVVLTRTLLNIRQVLLARYLLNPQTSSSSCINNYYMPINSLIT